MSQVYTCLIAEDNIIDRDLVEMYIHQIDSLTITATCSNGLEAANFLQQQQVDIVLTDIDMPGLSGLDLKKSISKQPVFIFISAFTEYAVESYELDVIDFLVKPVSLARLMKAVQKAIEYIELKKNLLTVAAAGPGDTSLATTPGTGDHFYVRDSNGYARIDNTSLVFVESMGNFSRLHTTDQKKHITLVSLKNVEQQLPATLFMRVHKQYIVNLHHILSLSTDGEIMLTGGHSIPSGAMYKAPLLDFINTRTLLR